MNRQLQLYLTTSVAVAVGLPSLLGVVDQDTVSAALTVLTVLAFRMAAVPGIGTGRPARPRSAPDRAYDARNAGPTLIRLPNFEGLLAVRTHLWVVGTDSVGPASADQARRSAPADDLPIFGDRMQPILEPLRELPAHWPSVEVRVPRSKSASELPPIDPSDAAAIIAMDMYSHRSPEPDIGIGCTADRDRYWHGRFCLKRDRSWASGRPADLFAAPGIPR